jgi:hypothetical protein
MMHGDYCVLAKVSWKLTSCCLHRMLGLSDTVGLMCASLPCVNFWGAMMQMDCFVLALVSVTEAFCLLCLHDSGVL